MGTTLPATPDSGLAGLAGLALVVSLLALAAFSCAALILADTTDGGDACDDT